MPICPSNLAPQEAQITPPKNLPQRIFGTYTDDAYSWLLSLPQHRVGSLPIPVVLPRVYSLAKVLKAKVAT